MVLFNTRLKTLGKLSFDLLQFRAPVVADPFAGFLGFSKIHSSSLLLTTRLSPNATSVRTETLQSLHPVSDQPVSTSGTLKIQPCHMDYLHLQILAFQCNPRASCRIRLVAAAGLILLFPLILLRLMPLQRGQEIIPIRKVNREPSHPILFYYSDHDQHLFERHPTGHGVVVRRQKGLMGINQWEGW